MRLVFHRHREGGLGLALNGATYDLEALRGELPGEWPHDVFSEPMGLLEAEGAVARLAAATRELDGLAEDHAARLPDGVALGPPVPRPRQILCAGLNYADHAREVGKQPPARPHVFSKLPAAVTGPADDIVYPRGIAAQIDYEVELAVLIGRRCRSVDAEAARSAVAGYLVVNDVSARDWQFADDEQLTLGKGFDTFLPMGPCLVTGDELPDPHELRIRTEVNGETRQDSTTAELICGVYDLIAFLSQITTLRPGDVVATGTPGGVAIGKSPPRFLEVGDMVTCEIERIGELRNRVSERHDEGSP